MMKLGSLFDGSGGFPLAGVLNDITPAWAAEVEPYPIAVTRSRFPGMKHYGNVCDINGAEIEPVDIITAGSPCQGMSIAGLRAGIYKDKRSNLFFESIRIVKEMRAATNGKQPRFFVWENVPGAFSSDKGGAFQAVLQAVCGVCDDTVSIPESKSADGADKSVWLAAGSIVGSGYSVAWRTLDAQYWGVPQRRARIYLVADFNSERAAEILFKPESLRGDMRQGNEALEKATADAVGCVDGSNGSVTLFDAYQHHGWRLGDSCGTLTAGQNDTIRGDTPLVVFALQANGIDRADNAGCNGCGWRENECYTADCRNNVLNEELSGTLQAKPNGGFSYNCINPCVYGIGNGQGDIAGHISRELVGTLDCMHDQQAVCYDAKGTDEGYYTRQRSDEFAECAIASCQSARQYKDATDIVVTPGKPPRRYIIRRLMPVECARLQGFPDTWGELAPYDGDDEFWEQVRKTHAAINGKTYKPVKDIKMWYDKLHNDGAEYKMWGNGIALPCAEYVIRMIKEEV